MAALKKKKSTSEQKILGLLNSYRIVCREYDSIDAGYGDRGEVGRAKQSLLEIRQNKINEITNKIVSLMR